MTSLIDGFGQSGSSNGLCRWIERPSWLVKVGWRGGGWSWGYEFVCFFFVMSFFEVYCFLCLFLFTSFVCFYCILFICFLYFLRVLFVLFCFRVLRVFCLFIFVCLFIFLFILLAYSIIRLFISPFNEHLYLFTLSSIHPPLLGPMINLLPRLPDVKWWWRWRHTN